MFFAALFRRKSDERQGESIGENKVVADLADQVSRMLNALNSSLNKIDGKPDSRKE